MSEPDSYYTPERIDRILRDWPAYESRAEHVASSWPDAHRPARGGGKSDTLVSADVCADIASAMVASLEVGSIEWKTIEYRRQGWTFGRMGSELHMAKQSAWERYQAALVKMATALGWREETPDLTPDSGIT